MVWVSVSARCVGNYSYSKFVGKYNQISVITRDFETGACSYEMFLILSKTGWKCSSFCTRCLQFTYLFHSSRACIVYVMWVELGCSHFLGV